MFKKRYLSDFILSDLKEKMVFLGGPRQVGKTTLAKNLGENEYARYSYFNWDYRDDKEKILSGKFESESDFLVFDEIHKYKGWRNYLKGEFDKNKDKYSIMATGSARLDLYRRGGDSLMGRYRYYRLHPFSLAEVLKKNFSSEIFEKFKFVNAKENGENFDSLLKFGGFPEPFVKQTEKDLKLFHIERVGRLIKQDVQDLERLRDISAIEILANIIPTKVGSLFSINSIKEDLQATHKTVSFWVEILERFYYHYRIYPFSFSTIKSLRKEPKIYLWDWSEVKNEGAKFENMIASHLLRLAHFLFDTRGEKAELFFLRDRDGHEVDFLVAVDKKPWFMVEAKLNDREILKNLLYFKERIKPLFSFQVVGDKGVDYMQKDVRVISADKFLSGLV